MLDGEWIKTMKILITLIAKFQTQFKEKFHFKTCSTAVIACLLRRNGDWSKQA